ncbi:MAG: PD-(D/E)XK nuclease family protein [Candidatus Omnitrophota bacterium]|nr:MAG: PD-(D/E)XK nuclease family protein [Candidatus Omnitrophota bacterium]
MGKLKNQLTWSFSRAKLFADCRRAYFYHYYASWGGWDIRTDEFSRRAYILKNIQGIDAWVGDIVHGIIKWILENRIAKREVSFKEASAMAKRKLLETWEQSRSKAWMKNVKANLNLFEHYYKRELSREELAVKLQKVISSLRGVYQCGVLDLVSSLPKESILAIDKIDSFEFEGIKMFAIPDFAIYNKEYVLYDWKTGQPQEQDILQLSCYVLYAVNKWKTLPHQIKIVPVYLAQGTGSPEPVQPQSLDRVKEYIRDSVSQMKSALLDVGENKIDVGQCPRTEHQWRCKNCKFQEICK